MVNSSSVNAMDEEKRWDVPTEPYPDSESVSLLNSEDAEELASSMARQRRIRTRNLALQLLVWVFMAVGWVLFAIKALQSPSFPAYAHPPQSPLPPEVFEARKKTFQRDDRYIGYNDATNQNWNHLVAGHDALYIENPEQYGLPAGERTPFIHENMASPIPTNFYVVSALHQLHCLNIIRVQYHQAAKNLTDHTPGYSPAKWAVHVDHCVEYLRQSISCGSLFAVEGATPLDAPGEEGHASTVTGWGIEHDCFNFEALRVFQIQQEARYNATWTR